MNFRSLQSEDLVLIHYINHPHWGSQLQCAQCLLSSSRELHRGCSAFSFSNYYRTSCSWEFVDDKRAFKKCVRNVVMSLERLSKCWWKNTVHCRWRWTWEEFYWLRIIFTKKCYRLHYWIYSYVKSLSATPYQYIQFLKVQVQNPALGLQQVNFLRLKHLESLQILFTIGQFCRLRLYLFLVHTLYFSGCCIYPIRTIGLVPIILSKAGLLFFMWILGDHWKLGKSITQTAKRSGVWNFCERKAFGIFRASCRFWFESRSPAELKVIRDLLSPDVKMYYTHTSFTFFMYTRYLSTYWLFSCCCMNNTDLCSLLNKNWMLPVCVNVSNCTGKKYC